MQQSQRRDGPQRDLTRPEHDGVFSVVRHINAPALVRAAACDNRLPGDVVGHDLVPPRLIDLEIGRGLPCDDLRGVGGYRQKEHHPGAGMADVVIVIRAVTRKHDLVALTGQISGYVPNDEPFAGAGGGGARPG